MILRFPAVSGLALAITFSLFFMMQLMVATGADVIQEPPRYGPINIGYEIEEPEVIRKPTEPPVFETVKQPPDYDVELNLDPAKAGSNRILYVAPVRAEIAKPGGADAGLKMDRDQAVVLVAIPPRYPGHLAAREIEGYVDVKFDTTKTGAVANAVVTFSTNHGFERSALVAIAKWKFKPRVVNGAPQMQFGVEKRIKYVLEQG